MAQEPSFSSSKQPLEHLLLSTVKGPTGLLHVDLSLSVIIQNSRADWCPRVCPETGPPCLLTCPLPPVPQEGNAFWTIFQTKPNMISGTNKTPWQVHFPPMRSLLASHTCSFISTLLGLPWAGVPPSATTRFCRPPAPPHTANAVPCGAREWRVSSVNSHCPGLVEAPEKEQ